jgi:SAM-dependent methyltransferase
MNNLSYLIEYYDELYDVSPEQKAFYKELSDKFRMPTRFLGIDCGTGYFEHFLAREGHDVTGLETSHEMLNRANLRRRMPNTALRYFQMSTLDMARYLGKGFYNIVSILNSKLTYITDKTLFRKFFYDCKQFLSQNGKLIVEIYNFTKLIDQPIFKLPERQSIRSKLFSEVKNNGDGTWNLKQSIEISSGKVLELDNDVKIMPVLPSDIEKCALEAGFSSINMYSDFKKTPYSDENPMAILEIS